MRNRGGGRPGGFALCGHFAFNVFERVTAVGVKVRMPESPALSEMRNETSRYPEMNTHALHTDFRQCS